MHNSGHQAITKASQTSSNPIQSNPMTLFLSLPQLSPQNIHIHTHTHHHRSLRLKPQASLPLSSNPPQSNQSSSHSKTGVIVIGAGLAGLAAATHLNSQNIPFLLLEASDAVGGRVRTDFLDGFLLDRGFQIFITAYPEAQKLLNYQALNLQKFYSGAQVYYDGKLHTVANPLRHIWDSLNSLQNPIGSLLDKLLIASNIIRVLTKSDEEIITSNEIPTIDLLRKTGFSDSIVGRFFRPFFGGIFFDKELETSSRLFDFIFKCLALGDNALPANGIAAIPQQLGDKLPPGSILFNSKVVSIDFDGSESESPPSLRLENGDVLRSELGVIVAVEEPEALMLLRETKPNPKPVRTTVCLYFSADRTQVPVREPVLFLNGSGKGIVNNMFFATNVAPSYGPPDKALISVSLIGMFEDMSDYDLTAEVVQELSGWFGEPIVRLWRHLRTYRIGYAQPNQCPPTDLMKNPRVGSGVYVCGDYLTSATFDGALVSGRRAVEALLRDRVWVSTSA
ncbi:hypothetical protein RGQ29_006289 [Quercus rubra]|uniref:Amine oxidase domain-containing protein n=1 Tax=Quercus rubra TaxID=3512 RepID=A0AAN7IBS0_QUERU|nr:hypothetical protein RGQ29_006289 [Quercus rubra]